MDSSTAASSMFATAGDGRPLVTVVIPTRNRPHLLERAVASVACQEVPLEIVVVDEASSPPVEPSSVWPGPTRIVRHDAPRGPAVARNVGAAAGQAPFVAFLDDDDVWYPEKLARCLELFDRWPQAGMVVHRMRFAGQRVNATHRAHLHHPGPDRMLHRQPPHVDAVVLRREIHASVRFDASFPAAADLDYMLRVALRTPIAELDTVLGEHGPAEQRTSEIALDRRIAGRERFLRLHGEHFDKKARAFYWVRMGHLQRRAGLRLAGARCFVRATVQEPASLLAWKGLAMCALPSSVVRRVHT